MTALPQDLRFALAICVGACVGALLRWRLGVWLNQPGAWMPWGTLTANWVGALVIGVCIGVFELRTDLDPTWRMFWITGLLGALTTFSSFSAEVIAMLQDGRLARALATTSLHLAGSLLLTWVGLQGVRRILS